VHDASAAWLMTGLAPSPLMVSLMQTATSLPFFLLALPAGALADIVDRRRLLLATQGWMVVAATVLGVSTVAGRTGPWLLLSLTFGMGLGNALNAPAWQATTPDLVPREELAAAVALGGISVNVARAVGPALGGLLVAALGPGWVFLLNAASFLGVVVVLARWQREVPRSPLPPEDVPGAMRAGVRSVRHSAPFRAVLARTAAFVVPASALWALLRLFARGGRARHPGQHGGGEASLGRRRDALVHPHGARCGGGAAPRRCRRFAPIRAAWSLEPRPAPRPALVATADRVRARRRRRPRARHARVRRGPRPGRGVPARRAAARAGPPPRRRHPLERLPRHRGREPVARGVRRRVLDRAPPTARARHRRRPRPARGRRPLPPRRRRTPRAPPHRGVAGGAATVAARRDGRPDIARARPCSARGVEGS